MGSHTTAWTVTENIAKRAVTENIAKRAVKDKQPKDAIGEITKLYVEEKKLPGVALARNTKLLPQFKGRFLAAEKQMESFANEAKSKDSLDFLQQYMQAYLEYAHSVPLSAASKGVAGGNREGEKMKALEERQKKPWSKDKEEQHKEKSEARSQMWGLLDANAVTYMTGSGGSSVDKMGAELIKNPNEAAAKIIWQHLVKMRALNETQFDESLLGSEESVKMFVENNDLGKPDDVWKMVQAEENSWSTTTKVLTTEKPGSMEHEKPSNKAMKEDEEYPEEISTENIEKRPVSKRVRTAPKRLAPSAEGAEEQLDNMEFEESKSKYVDEPVSKKLKAGVPKVPTPSGPLPKKKKKKGSPSKTKFAHI
jgi:hypothetical protein